MKILKWAEYRAQNMKWYHYSALKICIASGMLLFAKLFPVLLSLDWYWYAGVFVVTYIIMAKGFLNGSKG